MTVAITFSVSFFIAGKLHIMNAPCTILLHMNFEKVQYILAQRVQGPSNKVLGPIYYSYLSGWALKPFSWVLGPLVPVHPS